MHEQNDNFLKRLEDAAKRVSDWPVWKKEMMFGDSAPESDERSKDA